MGKQGLELMLRSLGVLADVLVVVIFIWWVLA